MKKRWKILAFFTILAALMTANITSFADDTESRKLSILRSEGEKAYVKKNTSKKYKAKAGMNLGEGNQVLTGKDSYIYIEADDDKILKLDSNTNVSVEKASPKSLKLTLNTGKLFFNVEKPLAKDEEMEFKAAHTSMSIRGTCGFFTYTPMELTFQLAEGTVAWDLGDEGTFVLKAGQHVKMIRDWGDRVPGPGSDAGYIFESTGTFTWEDLSISQLMMLLENAGQKDLSGIGLNSDEAIEAARKKITDYEEQKRKEEEERWAQFHNDDDDDYSDDWKENIKNDDGHDDFGGEIVPGAGDDGIEDDFAGEIVPGDSDGLSTD